MQIHVKYFSVLASITGKRDEIIELPENSSGESLMEAITDKYPGIDPYREYLKLAVNLDYSEFDRILQPKDEVALIPPVSGG